MAKKASRRGHKAQVNQAKSITNRRARHDYELGDSLVVGLELTGAETKSLRMGHGQLRGAYVTVKGNELYLLNATVHGSPGIPVPENIQSRTRKLLAKRREIDALTAAKTTGRTIVPLEILTQGRYIKIRLAVGKGKKNWDKRETLKQRDDDRSAQRAMRAKQ
ncbi:SsrA-binding protein SmpB [Candidatus Saccharibacteria bacterium]|nr:MAG: SsrA-binding protein SmpB [Candidatus Saccharibacteria bacterium]